MKTLRALPAALIAGLLLAGCTAAPATVVTVTATPSAVAPTVSAVAALCDYNDMGGEDTFDLVIQAWRLVKQTPRTGLHQRAITDLSDFIELAKQAESPDLCTGHDELLALGAKAEELNIAVGLSQGDVAEVSEYVEVAAAGNAWFDAVGYTTKRFA